MESKSEFALWLQKFMEVSLQIVFLYLHYKLQNVIFICACKYQDECQQEYINILVLSEMWPKSKSSGFLVITLLLFFVLAILSMQRRESDISLIFKSAQPDINILK